MITRPTVLVLGAGASAPYGFPTGGKLLREIVSDLEPGSELARELELVFGYPGDLIRRFRQELSKSMAPSIDAFLENSQDYVGLGKTAIALKLVPLEIPAGIERGKLRWYEHLMAHLDLTADGFAQNTLSVITFNYDRSFEYYLHRALRNNNRLSHEDALVLLREMDIVHVHGQLGGFSNKTKEGFRIYEKDVSVETMKIARNGIIVQHEAQPASVEFIQARELLKAAEMICFVGFGYLPVNIQRLGVQRLADKKERKARPPHFFGSAYGVGIVDMNRVKRSFYSNITMGERTEVALDFLRNRVDLA